MPRTFKGFNTLKYTPVDASIMKIVQGNLQVFDLYLIDAVGLSLISIRLQELMRYLDIYNAERTVTLCWELNSFSLSFYVGRNASFRVHLVSVHRSIDKCEKAIRRQGRLWSTETSWILMKALAFKLVRRRQLRALSSRLLFYD